MTTLEQELATEAISSIRILMHSVQMCASGDLIGQMDCLGNNSTRSLLLSIAQELHSIGERLSENVHFRGYMLGPMKQLGKGIRRLQETSSMMGHGLDYKSVAETVSELIETFLTHEELDELQDRVDHGQITVKAFVHKLTHFTY